MQPSIAIIGMGSMFAKSPDIKAFWRNLLNGRDCISDPPATHFQLNDIYDADPKKPDHIYCNRGGFLPAVSFDPTEFGIPPNALEATDTSQLLGLLVAKAALADAGYGEDREFDRDRTSVILGVTGTQELVISLGSRLGHPFWRRALEGKGLSETQKASIVTDIADSYVSWQENSFPGLLGNVVAGRICNRLNLGGTNCVVDAACASSLSAIYLAIMELATGRSDMVITGGVDTINDSFMHMCFSKTGVLSRTGDARPFAADADGTVLGEGIGMLVLKRLSDAERDGNRIYASIRGIGSSSDGKSQSIYAPRAEGQARALRQAYRQAGVPPESIAMVEAHGTGTRVGDEVEFSALKQVFGAVNPNGNHCALGSVKSLIGHTKAAAGAAGMIKSVLSLHNKVLLPTIKADRPDPKLNIDASPFYLNRTARPWFSSDSEPRRCGVSAFGFGGSNFHVVLEEYGRKKNEIAWDGRTDLLVFSGLDADAITTGLEGIERLFRERSDYVALSGAARTLRADFSTAHPQRLTMVVDTTRSADRFIEQLRTAAEAVSNGKARFHSADGIYYAVSADAAGKMAFLFPGQGSQYPYMGRDLVCTFPMAMQAIEEANRCWRGPTPLWEVLFPRPHGAKDGQHEAVHALRGTDVAQPAIGAISLAMLSVLAYFDVRPDAACGHSYGELPALHAAGWIDRTTLLTLSVARGRLMAEAARNGDAGGMLAVKAPIGALQALAAKMPDVVLANINSPDQGVLSGGSAAIAKAQTRCQEAGWPTVALPVAAAFHSPLVEAARAPFATEVAKAVLTPGPIPVYANASAAPYPNDPLQAAQLLGRQLTSPVPFQAIVEHLYTNGIRTFVEVGPKTVLTGLVRSILKDRDVNLIALDRSSGKTTGTVDLAHALGHLAALGVEVDLKRWESVLPTSKAQKMTIPLSGTNYRRPGKRTPAINEQDHPKADFKPSRPAPPTVAASDMPATTSNVNTSDPMNMDRPINNPYPGPPAPTLATHQPGTSSGLTGTTMPNALALVQKGLESIQSLQQQTARAHQKFLDTQAQASRTLQEMMQSARKLAGVDAGLSPTPDIGDHTPVVHPHPTAPPQPCALPPGPEPSEPTAATAVIHPGTAAEAMIAPAPASPPAPPASAPASAAAEAVASALLQIVAELTGYPEAMLDLAMDIEADLGIDSIKRVEILSAMEERMPRLPRVTPDMVGTLKTLGQICDYLASGEASSAAAETAPDRPDAAPDPAPPDIQTTLLSIVAELTGYPEAMLDLAMDIEADLGIDSIKRVEILSAMEERMPRLPRVTPDMVGTLKTLGQICDYLASGEASSAAADVSTQATTTSHRLHNGSSKAVPRQIIDVVHCPKAPGRLFQMAPKRWVAVLDDASAMARSLVLQLERRQIASRLVPADAPNAVDRFDGAAGLIVCAQTSAEAAFLAAQQAAPELMAAAGHGDALFGVITTMGGAFGFSEQAVDNPEQGALPGLLKTAALEWPQVICRAIDLAADFSDSDAAAGQAVAELLTLCEADPMEVGLGADRRVTLTPVPAETVDGPLRLDSSQVVVVTGGARGVTAACALSLARASGAAIAVVGRSAPPFAEPAWLREIDGEAAMKQAIAANHAFADSRPTVKALQAAYDTYAANRAIRQTLTALQTAGVAAGYYRADVTDRTGLATTITAIRNQMGPIAGLIHGAGLIHDRLIVDKTVDQFRKVYAVKVDGLKHLLAATDGDHLRYLVLFSSVSARTGNTGQCDYAMANEALNKIARSVALQRPQCRVTSINWGPWDGGMVTPALKKAMAGKGVDLIPIEIGAAMMVAEMKNADPNPVEVLIGSMLPSNNGPGNTAGQPEKAAMALLERREIDLQRYPVLASHVIGGKPVVPFALIYEWIGHGAVKENPGFSLHGIDDFRLLSGIRLETEKKLVRLMAGKAQKTDETWSVNLELRNGVKNGRDVIHSSARALLVDRFPEAPIFNSNGKNGDRPYPRDLEAVYKEILFHGTGLRAIRSIETYADHGMTARLVNAPKPEAWMQDPIQGRWMADPMVMDGAFQMAIVWRFEQTGSVCLPSYARAYRQYRQCFPDAGVTAVMSVSTSTQRKMVADFTFLDADKKVVATLSGYEATVDETLIHAFRDNVLPTVITGNRL